MSEDIVIPPKHYNSLIGAGGKLIHAIMEECGGVTIKFPPAESNSDKVTIRGPKDDVEKAKQQLLELSTERQLSGFSAEVRAKPQHHKFLIGRNGVNIKKVRDYQELCQNNSNIDSIQVAYKTRKLFLFIEMEKQKQFY